MTKYKEDIVTIDGVDHIVLHEDLDQMPPVERLEKMTDMFNKGMWISDIAKKLKRDEWEVFLAIGHQARYSRITRPLGKRAR